jgi:hypothetical protein
VLDGVEADAVKDVRAAVSEERTRMYPSAEKLDTICVTMFCIEVMTLGFSVFRSTSATELSPSQHISTLVCEMSVSTVMQQAATILTWLL